MGHVNVTSGSDSHSYVTESPKDRVQLVPEFLRFEDAAAILRISEREIYRLVEEGELVVSDYKRRRLIDPASVKALADKIRSGAFAPEVVAA
jgi:hypothetical protein